MAGDTKAFTIPAGGTYPINGNGETFMFCQFTDRPIRVKIAGKTVTMRAGGYQEFEPLSGPNARVEFENTDPDNPAAVIFIMGTGTYDEKIIRGDVSITPVLRKADGTTKPDTRYDLTIDLTPITQTGGDFSQGQTLRSANPTDAPNGSEYEAIGGGLCFGPGDRLYQMLLTLSPNNFYLVEYNEDLSVASAQSYNFENIGDGDLGWTQESGFFFSWDNETKIYSIGNSRTVLMNFKSGYRMGSFCVDFFTKKIYVLQIPGNSADNGIVTEHNPDFTATGREWAVGLNTDDNFSLTLDPVNDEFYIGVDNSFFVFDRDFQLLREITDTTGFASPNTRVGEIVGNLLYETEKYRSKSTKLKIKAIRDFSTSPEVKAIKGGCALADAKRKPTAAIQPTGVTFDTQGYYLRATGQVIRALLEYYFKATVADDYMDHVYGLDLQLNANGSTFKPIVTGNETFARAGVTDDFTFLIPNRATIKIDNELELGSALALQGV